MTADLEGLYNDSYTKRRFLYSFPAIGSEPLGGFTLAGLDGAGEHVVVWEAIPKADMDALRDLARCAMKWRNDEPLSRSEFVAAIAALSPAFLETLEKP